MDRFDHRLTRRTLLATLAAVPAGCAVGPADRFGTSAPAAPPVATATPPAVPRLGASPFTLGIASGDPLPDGVVLWTRLAPEPLAGRPGALSVSPSAADV